MISPILDRLLVVLVLAGIVLLQGCASPGSTAAPVAHAPKPTLPKEAIDPDAATLVEAEKELGSLWSETSSWNEVFSVGQARKPGDIVFIKPSENFRSLLAGGKLAERATQEDVRDRAVIPIPARIRHVYPRGLYRVSALEKTKLVSGTIETLFTGKLREKDIGDDETIGSELVFDTHFDSVFTPDETINTDLQKNKKADSSKKPKAAEKPKTPEPPKAKEEGENRG